MTFKEPHNLWLYWELSLNGEKWPLLGQQIKSSNFDVFGWLASSQVAYSLYESYPSAISQRNKYIIMN